MSEELNKTPLNAAHRAAGGKMVDFGGWDMPVQYAAGVIEEHMATRTRAGLFDVSHMGEIWVEGEDAIAFVNRITTNDVTKLVDGQAHYSALTNERGGVVDDLITYFGDEQHFRVVVNAGTRDKDTAWLKRWAEPFKVDIQPRTDLAMVAVQGPNARAKAAQVIGKSADSVLGMKPFFSRQLDSHYVATTGYTGEDGWEVILPAKDIAAFWVALRDAGVAQCGLGARDTLRLEAGMNLYGNDMDENQSPLESGLTWTVAFDPPERDFVGRAALEAQRAAGVKRKLVGLILDERGVLRGHQRVASPAGDGELTSGTFSPTMEKSIGFARVPVATGDRVEVDIRGKLLSARVVKYPFVRNGKPLVS